MDDVKYHHVIIRMVEVVAVPIEVCTRRPHYSTFFLPLLLLFSFLSNSTLAFFSASTFAFASAILQLGSMALASISITFYFSSPLWSSLLTHPPQPFSSFYPLVSFFILLLYCAFTF